MNRVVPELTDVHHIKLCYSKDTYCGHPRQCPIYNYGNGEIVVIHHHAPATYQTREDIRHGQTGYKGRAKILLQRSYDHGQTWSHENEVVIWDDSRPLEEKRAILWQADEPGVTREQIDLASPDTAIYFARPRTGPADADGGRLWNALLSALPIEVTHGRLFRHEWHHRHRLNMCMWMELPLYSFPTVRRWQRQPWDQVRIITSWGYTAQTTTV